MGYQMSRPVRQHRRRQNQLRAEERWREMRRAASLSQVRHHASGRLLEHPGRIPSMGGRARGSVLSEQAMMEELLFRQERIENGLPARAITVSTPAVPRGSTDGWGSPIADRPSQTGRMSPERTGQGARGRQRARSGDRVWSEGASSSHAAAVRASIGASASRNGGNGATRQGRSAARRSRLANHGRAASSPGLTTPGGWSDATESRGRQRRLRPLSLPQSPLGPSAQSSSPTPSPFTLELSRTEPLVTTIATGTSSTGGSPDRAAQVSPLRSLGGASYAPVMSGLGGADAATSHSFVIPPRDTGMEGRARGRHRSGEPRTPARGESPQRAASPQRRRRGRSHRATTAGRGEGDTPASQTSDDAGFAPTVPLNAGRPGRPVAGKTTAESVEFVWEAPLGMPRSSTVYEVAWRRFRDGLSDGAEWVTVPERLRHRSHTIAGLTPGSCVQFRVRAWVPHTEEAVAAARGTNELDDAVTRIGQGDWSDWAEASVPVMTPQMAPSRPRAPRPRRVTTTSIKLVWDPPFGNGATVNLYTVLCGSDYEDMSVLYSGTSRTCDAVGLRPSTAYTFVLIASNRFGDSDASEPTVVHTPAPSVDAPLREVGAWQEWWNAQEGRPYFVNSETGETAGTLPAHLNRVLRRFGEWQEFWDETSQHCFYYNTRTQERRWEPPDALSLDDSAVVSGAWGAGGNGDERGRVASRRGRRQERQARRARRRADEATGRSDTAAASATAQPVQSSVSVTDTATLSRADIDFRKKRYYLLWEARASDVRPSALTLTVRRGHETHDTLRSVRRWRAAELQQKLQVTFDGEEGIDSGGLLKELCLLVSRGVQAPSARLFRRSSSGHLDVSPTACRRPGGLEELRALGRFLGKAVFDRQLVDLPLSRATCLWVTGKRDALALEDLIETDAELVAGLRWVLQNSVDGIVEATFSAAPSRDDHDGTLPTTRAPRVPGGRRGSFKSAKRRLSVAMPSGGGGAGSARADGEAKDETVDLVPDGRRVAVTDDNKESYCLLMGEWRGWGEVRAGLNAFANGIYELLPAHSLAKFSVDELRALLNGRRDVDVAAMRLSAAYAGGLMPHTQEVVWFWEVLASITAGERGAVLRFCTGTSMVPLDGFEPAFTLVRDTGPSGDDTDANVDGLPRAHTCFNQLCLPAYSSKKKLRERLLFAVNNTEGFRLA